MVGVGYFLISRTWRTAVFVFDNGLVRVGEGKVDTCRWDEIQNIHYTSEEKGGLFKSRSYTLQLADGRLLIIADVANFEKLAATVRQKTQNRLVNQAQA